MQALSLIDDPDPLAAILNHDKSREEIKEIIEDAGRQEIPVLERDLVIPGTIASIAVLLGLRAW